MPNPEQILQDTVDKIATSTSTKERLDHVNDAITKLHELQLQDQNEIDIAANTVLFLLTEISWKENEDIKANSYQLDYMDIDQFSDASLLSPYAELYLDYMALIMERLSFKQWNLDVRSNQLELYHRDLYENIESLKVIRREYITLLETLPDNIITCYPNPVTKWEQMTVSINTKIVTEGMWLYKKLISTAINVKDLSLYLRDTDNSFDLLSPVIMLPWLHQEWFWWKAYHWSKLYWRS